MLWVQPAAPTCTRHHVPSQMWENVTPFQVMEHCMYPTQGGPHCQQLQWQNTSGWRGHRYGRCREAQQCCAQIIGLSCDGREYHLQKTQHSCRGMVEHCCHNHSSWPALDPVQICNRQSGTSFGMWRACHYLCRLSSSAWPKSVPESCSCTLFRAQHVSLHQVAGQIVLFRRGRAQRVRQWDHEGVRSWFRNETARSSGRVWQPVHHGTVYDCERNAWSVVTWPLIPVLDVEDVKDLKASVVKLMMETYLQLWHTADKLNFATFFDPELSLVSCVWWWDWLAVACFCSAMTSVFSCVTCMLWKTIIYCTSLYNIVCRWISPSNNMSYKNKYVLFGLWNIICHLIPYNNYMLYKNNYMLYRIV